MNENYEALYKNKDWLTTKYSQEKLSAKQIGNICHISYKLVNVYLREYGLISSGAAELLEYP